MSISGPYVHVPVHVYTHILHENLHMYHMYYVYAFSSMCVSTCAYAHTHNTHTHKDLVHAQTSDLVLISPNVCCV